MTRYMCADSTVLAVTKMPLGYYAVLLQYQNGLEVPAYEFGQSRNWQPIQKKLDTTAKNKGYEAFYSSLFPVEGVCK